MGVIVPPIGGIVYLDANALIYSVETHADFWPLLEPVWDLAQAGQLQLATSELSLLELLVGPIRNLDSNLILIYEGVLASPEVSVHPISQEILREAARLRASRKGLRTPDAIHAATGLVHPPSLFITNDSDFRKIPGLPVIVLKDLLKP